MVEIPFTIKIVEWKEIELLFFQNISGGISE